MKAKKVILIRHAESESNVGGVFEHKHIIKITEKGKQQARELAEILDKPERIIVSKFIRTIETAEPAILKFPESEVHLWIDTHEFHYVDPKKYRGITEDERDAMVKEFWEKRDPMYRDSLDVESFSGHVNRVNGVITKMKKIPDGLNYIFTHGLFIRTVFVLLKHFPDFNEHEKTDSYYKEIMETHGVLTRADDPPVKNTSMFDITELLLDYK